MDLRPLGRTDQKISAIGLGCWQFSEGKGIVGGFWAALAPDLVQSIVAASLAGGVSWFDTAEAYGGGKSEESLARALHGLGKKPGEVTVATKWFPFGRTAGSITATIDERLRCLGGYPIDLHQIHNAVGGLSGHAAQLGKMADLVAAKKIRAVGISNFNARQMRACHAELARRGLPLASNQMPYSLLDRKIETSGVLEAAKELGITIIAYSPLAQGLLTGKFHDDPGLIQRAKGPRKWLPGFRKGGLEKTRPLIEALRRIGAKHQATPSQVALNWLVSFHGDTVVAIPGASSVKQAEENAGALRFALDAGELEELDRLSRK